MSFDMFKRLGSFGKKAQSAGSNAGQSVADAFGLKPGTSNPIAIDFGAGALKILHIHPICLAAATSRRAVFLAHVCYLIENSPCRLELLAAHVLDPVKLPLHHLRHGGLTDAEQSKRQDP